jgi:hypothetical protein
LVAGTKEIEMHLITAPASNNRILSRAGVTSAALDR